MAALVADYSSSESGGESEAEAEPEGGRAQARAEEEEEEEGEAAKLPPPELEGALPRAAGVFANPFAQERRERLRLLEKHVRLTGRLGQQGAGGPPICLAYRKDGRCRYGVNCKFAHDSDLPATLADGGPGDRDRPPGDRPQSPDDRRSRCPVAPGNQAQAPFGQQARCPVAPGNQAQAPFSQQARCPVAPGNQAQAPFSQQARCPVAPGNGRPGTKRGPGLSPGLLPPKRSLRNYQAQRAKEGLGFL